jgi:hypothetical protein
MQSIFLSFLCFLSFLDTIGEFHYKGGKKKTMSPIPPQKTNGNIFSSLPLMAIIKNRFFLYFWLPSWNLLKKYSHVILFYSYFILFFRNISNEDHFFPPKKIIFICVKKIIFFFLGQKNSKIRLHQPPQPKLFFK